MAATPRSATKLRRSTVAKLRMVVAVRGPIKLWYRFLLGFDSPSLLFFSLSSESGRSLRRVRVPVNWFLSCLLVMVQGLSAEALDDGGTPATMSATGDLPASRRSVPASSGVPRESLICLLRAPRSRGCGDRPARSSVFHSPSVSTPFGCRCHAGTARKCLERVAHAESLLLWK